MKKEDRIRELLLELKELMDVGLIYVRTGDNVQLIAPSAPTMEEIQKEGPLHPKFRVIESLAAELAQCKIPEQKAALMLLAADIIAYQKCDQHLLLLSSAHRRHQEVYHPDKEDGHDLTDYFKHHKPIAEA